MSRAEAKQETREALIRAGTTLFRERGVNKTKIRDITARAGVTPGTFYVHFAGKDAFVAHLVAEIGAQHVRVLLGAALEHLAEGPRVIIEKQAQAHVQFWRSHIDFFPLYASFVASNATEETMLRGPTPRVSQFVQAALANAGLNSRVPIPHIASSIFSSWRQIAMDVSRASEPEARAAVDALTAITTAVLDATIPGILELNASQIAAAYAGATRVDDDGAPEK